VAASFQIFSSLSVIIPFDLCRLDIDSTIKCITRKKGGERWKGKGLKKKKAEGMTQRYTDRSNGRERK
jgi:hypothetical protein